MSDPEIWASFEALRKHNQEERQKRGELNAGRLQQLKATGLVTLAWFAPTVVRIRLVKSPRRSVDFWPTTERWRDPQMRRAKEGWDGLLLHLGIEPTEGLR